MFDDHAKVFVEELFTKNGTSYVSQPNKIIKKSTGLIEDDLLNKSHNSYDLNKKNHSLDEYYEKLKNENIKIKKDFPKHNIFIGHRIIDPFFVINLNTEMDYRNFERSLNELGKTIPNLIKTKNGGHHIYCRFEAVKNEKATTKTTLLNKYLKENYEKTWIIRENKFQSTKETHINHGNVVLFLENNRKYEIINDSGHLILNGHDVDFLIGKPKKQASIYNILFDNLLKVYCSEGENQRLIPIKWSHDDSLKKENYNSKDFKYKNISKYLESLKTPSNKAHGFSFKLQSPYLVIDIDYKEDKGLKKAENSINYIQNYFEKLKVKIGFNPIKDCNYIKTRNEGRHIYCKVDEASFGNENAYLEVYSKLKDYFKKINKASVIEGIQKIQIELQKGLVYFYITKNNKNNLYKKIIDKKIFEITKDVLNEMLNVGNEALYSKNDKTTQNIIEKVDTLSINDAKEVSTKDIQTSNKETPNEVKINKYIFKKSCFDLFGNNIVKSHNGQYEAILYDKLNLESPSVGYNDGWFDSIMKAFNLTCFFAIYHGFDVDDRKKPLENDPNYENLIKILTSWSLQSENKDHWNTSKIENEIRAKVESLGFDLRLHFDYSNAVKIKNESHVITENKISINTKNENKIIENRHNFIKNESKVIEKELYGLNITSLEDLQNKIAIIEGDKFIDTKSKLPYTKDVINAKLGKIEGYEGLASKYLIANSHNGNKKTKIIENSIYKPQLPNDYQDIIQSSAEFNYYLINKYVKNSIANIIDHEWVNHEIIQTDLELILILFKAFVGFENDNDAENKNEYLNLLSYPYYYLKKLDNTLNKMLILISEAQGVGKSLIFTFVRFLIGTENYRNLSTKRLSGQFTNGIENHRVVSFEELAITKRNQIPVFCQLNELVTHENTESREMRKDLELKNNPCNILISTNNTEFLNIDDTGQRRNAVAMLDLDIDKYNDRLMAIIKESKHKVIKEIETPAEYFNAVGSLINNNLNYDSIYNRQIIKGIRYRDLIASAFVKYFEKNKPKSLCNTFLSQNDFIQTHKEDHDLYIPINEAIKWLKDNKNEIRLNSITTYINDKENNFNIDKTSTNKVGKFLRNVLNYKKIKKRGLKGSYDIYIEGAN